MPTDHPKSESLCARSRAGEFVNAGRVQFRSLPFAALNTAGSSVGVPLILLVLPRGFAAIVLLWSVVFAHAVETATVDWNAVHQRIDGFGASSAWRGSWSTAQADMFFSTNSGVGLSFLRNHIAYASSTSPSATPSTAEITIMQMAQARGARVWSAPWTPPSGFKSNNGPNGGNYLGSGNNPTNLAYASQLANYVANMKATYGINLYALSVQNEPDANVTTYEACIWTGAQIHDFVTNLYGALTAKGVGSTKIILPESESWGVSAGLFGPSLNDAGSAAKVSIIANHNYVANNAVGDTTAPAALSVSGKACWETEVSQIGGNFDGSIANAIYWAGRIHLFMTSAQANAWHYWWLIPSGADNEGLTDANGVPAKRMYALGQFARFVRPNFYRIGVTTTGSAEISAYKDSVSPRFAIVAINPNASAIEQTFNLTNITGISSVVPWMTTSNLSLVSQTAVTVTNAGFTYTLPPLSIVTFVGQVNPPMLTITHSSENVTVSWSTPTSGYYSLLQSPTLDMTNWSTNTSPVTVTNGTSNVSIMSPTGNLFFRWSNP